MKRFLWVYALLLFVPQFAFGTPYPMMGPSTTGYVLNGLYYQGGYGNYTWGSPNEIMGALEGTGSRLATRAELLNLFDDFGLPINGSSSDEAAFVNFEQYFDFTWGMQDGPADNPFGEMVIDGIYQTEVPGDFSPLATVWHYFGMPDAYISTNFSDPGTGWPNDLSLDTGISAWTVTPFTALPEPASILLLGAGLIGAAGRKYRIRYRCVKFFSKSRG